MQGLGTVHYQSNLASIESNPLCAACWYGIIQAFFFFFPQLKGMRDWLYHAGFIISWMMQTCAMPEQWPQAYSSIKTKNCFGTTASPQVIRLVSSSEWAVAVYGYRSSGLTELRHLPRRRGIVPRCKAYRGNCTYLPYVLYGNFEPWFNSIRVLNTSWRQWSCSNSLHQGRRKEFPPPFC